MLALDSGNGLSEKAFGVLEPGYRFLLKWVVVFFVPALLRCALLETGFGAADWARLVAMLVLGYLLTFVCTAAVASLFTPKGVDSAASLRTFLLDEPAAGALKASPKATPSQPRPPYRRFLLGIVCALCLRNFRGFGVAAESMFMVCMSLMGFTSGQRLPPAVQKYVHPLLVCAAATLGGAAAWAELSGPTVHMLSIVTTYTSWPGGGAVLNYFLPPTLVALGLLLFEFRAVLRRDLVPILATSLVSAAVTVFSTPLLARLLQLPRMLAVAAVSRAVSSPFAVDIATALKANTALAVGMTTFSGLLGVVSGQLVFSALRLQSPRARGLSMSGAAQGIGAISFAGTEPEAFTYGLVGFITTGTATALICQMPPLARLLLRLMPAA